MGFSPVVLPFADSFTGVEVLESHEPDAKALLSFSGQDINIVNSTFEGLSTQLGAVLRFVNNSVAITRSTFRNNAAGLTGSILVEDLSYISVNDCQFSQQFRSEWSGLAISVNSSS